MGRPSIDELLPVPDDAFILRRIPRGAYEPGQADGKCLTNELFVSGEFKPSADSYGHSIYVESRLTDGAQTLIDIDDAWKKQGIVRVQVRELQQFELEVRYSPDDCTYEGEELRNAHATVVGFDRGRRNRLVAYLKESHILQHPTDPV